MKMLFVGRKFGGVAGGVERMTIMLMNAMSERGHNVSLFTWDAEDAKAFYPINKEISWRKMDMGNPMEKASWLLRLKRMKKIRSFIDKDCPDVIIAFQQGPFAAIRLFTIGLGVPVIVAIRNAPTLYDHTKAGKFRYLLYQVLRLARKIVIQLESYKESYPGYLHSRIVTVPNPVKSVGAKASPGARKVTPKVILNVGRLSYQKNQSVLIRAFAMLVPEFPDWKLRLVGGGEDQENLEMLTAELGVAEKIDFIGPVEDVSEYYRSSDIFCFPSLWEGFPNALAEAFAHGLPAVGFSACAGTNELIKPDINGQLVDGNFEDSLLADSLSALMRDDVKREKLGRQAMTISDEYSPNTIFSRWENLFDSVCCKQ